MHRCRYCPSTEFHSSRFHFLDYLLILFAIRRRRCVFCSEVQSFWLLPRPLQWGVKALAVVVLYLASTGPVAWMRAHGGISQSTYERIDGWVYAPINSVLDRDKHHECPVTAAYVSYLEWWAPPLNATSPPPPQSRPPSKLSKLNFEMSDLDTR